VDEPEDGDILIGNPKLEDETAMGLDIGVEQTLEDGIFGVNFFYRDVSNVIEQTSLGASTTGEGDGILQTFANTGDGTIMGLEFDYSAPLAENTGLFFNATLLDSEITDPFTGEDRTFQNQAEYVYNVGITQTHPDMGLSYGFSYQKQGESKVVEFNREITLEYDANLELFAEKYFGEQHVLRFTVNNALDAKKTESFDRYESGEAETSEAILENHLNGNITAHEVEVEQADPTYSLTYRYNFGQ
ncbi:MAG TPA: TonB-dependent receptor, partial [Gammaproteobacteria bacterium]